MCKLNSAPRFLLLASFPDSISIFRGELIKAICAAGYEVHVAAPELSASSTATAFLLGLRCVPHDVSLRRNGTDPVADFRLLAEYQLLMRNVRPDVVLGYTIKPIIYGTTAAWLGKVPNRFALVTGLGYAFTSARSGFLIKLIDRLYRFALARASKVFFQNPDDEALFLGAGMLPASVASVVVNGSGVDTEKFALTMPPPGAPAFLMIGRLLGDKGVREYVAAAKLLKARYPEASFRLVGWIDSNPDAIEQRELDGWIADGAIEFLGRLGDVRAAIAASSVYVLPSYREGTPRTVLEAMAMGRPVITTNAPGCRETVIDGDNGFLVPVGSVDELVKAMTRFINEPELVAAMGRRSREIAENKYDVHAVNAVMLREMGILVSDHTP